MAEIDEEDENVPNAEGYPEPFRPTWYSAPGDTIVNLLENRGWTVQQFANELDYPLELTLGVLGTRFAITLGLTTRLANVLGSSPRFWERRELQYQERLPPALRYLRLERTLELGAHFGVLCGELEMDEIHGDMDRVWREMSSEEHLAANARASAWHAQNRRQQEAVDTGPPCEESFERLARERPDALRLWLPTLEPHLLTFAAEILGRHQNDLFSQAALIRVLEHEKPVVREGAILGLGNHVKDPDTDEIAFVLKSHAKRETTPALVALVRELLE